jgi:hypothetical protein
MKSKAYDFGVLVDRDRRAIYGVNLRRWAADVQRGIMERGFLPHVDVAFAYVSAKRADELAQSLGKWPPLLSFWVIPDTATIEEAQKQS